MSESLQSSLWYRVALVRPRLRSHARLHRMRYRGALWYALQDPVSNKVHRFRPAVRFVIAAMDGERTVQKIWELANHKLGEDAPSQDEVIRLLGQLYTADLLQSDATPDVTELFERSEREARSLRQRSYLNPMAIRVHLLDPDRLLNRIRPVVDWLWSRWGGLLWLVVVLPVLLLLPPQWAELSGNFSDRMFAADNLLLLWLVFPLIKAAHEFGHAAALKRGGGEVHDLGVVMLIMIPVPYVEATASSVFKSRLQRALVGASGMAVELFISALAFYLWLLLEPSTLRSVLFNVMVVASVSTVVFNGNPLLRYDGYYILSDLIEMPNLASRSMRYLGYLAERYLLGRKDASTPERGRRDTLWLALYGVLSTIYRVLVTLAIALFIANEFFIFGVLLALWAVATMVVVPVFKTARHLFTSPQLQRHRQRVIAVTAGLSALLVLLVFVLPMRHHTVVQGVAWLPESALVRAGQAGFLERLVASPGAKVAAGDVLMELRDPALQTKLAVAQARVAELQASYSSYLGSDRSLAAIALDQLEAEQTALASAEEQVARLVVRAATEGSFIVPNPGDMPERFFQQGAMLGYVLKEPQLLARVVVGQDAVDLVRASAQSVLSVQVRTVHQPDTVLEGRLQREVPAGDAYLPSRVLATQGGGQLATDPRDTKGDRTLERTFQFDVQVPLPAGQGGQVFFGERLYARFEHPAEPLASQWYRSIRRLFLSHFHV